MASIAVLLALGAPFLSATVGQRRRASAPADSPSRVAADVQADDFGGETSTANVVVSGADDAGLAAYERDAVEDRRRRLGRQPIDRRPSGEGATTSLVQVTWTGNSQSQASQDVVKDIRGVEVPGGGEALVGGASAQTVDLIDSIGAHLPWMGADRRRGDVRAAVPGLRVGGAAAQGGRDERRSRSPRRSGS